MKRSINFVWCVGILSFLSLFFFNPLLSMVSAAETDWIQTGTNVTLKNLNDMVGIGVKKPASKLDVGGTLHISGNSTFDGSGFFGNTVTINNGFALTNGVFNVTANSGLVNLTLSSSQNAFNVNNGLFKIDTQTQKVGVGISIPMSKLHVNGMVTAKKLNLNNPTGAETVGVATINAGMPGVAISTTAVTANSFIFITPKTLTSQPLAVVSQTPGSSFYVGIGSSIPQPVTFNWFIVDKNGSE